MVRRRRQLPYSGLAADAVGLTAASLTIGVGAKVVGDVGGNAGGLGQLGTALPVMGSLIGMKHTLRAVRELQDSTIGRGRRKRYYGY